MIPLVVDTNVLIAFFWKASTARRLISRTDLALAAPEYALEEIRQYTSVILQKARISLDQFRVLKKELAQQVEFVPVEEYQAFLEAAQEIPDKDDIDFVALALKRGSPLWSNDKRLKEQTLVTVLSTEEMVSLLSVFQE